MTQKEILDYNKRCTEVLKLETYTYSEEEIKFYNECHPDSPEYVEAYKIPLNFPFEYVHPAVVHIFYNNPDDVPVQTERVALAKLKFHSDWNWIMKVIEAIEKIFTKEPLFKEVYQKWLNEIDGKDFLIFRLEKEETVQAINQFLIWYNGNK